MGKILVLSLFAILTLSLIGVVSAEFSCSIDSDCEIHICSRECVNESFSTPQGVGCAFPPEMLPKKCSCINNVCVNVSENCVERNSSCCLGEICNTGFPNCLEGTEPVFEGCDTNCMAKVGCVKANASCKNLYWFDNDNKNCSQKQFCGAYMYLGLQTFESKTQCEKAVNETKNNIEKPKNITFIPWQKRNASECPIGCKCVGAVVSCTTADGKIMTIEAGRSGNIITITVNRKEANTTLELETEAVGNNKTKIKTVLSNGRKAEIKIMPDTASETAIAKLGELGFIIELKEVGKGTKDDKVVYELTGNKEGKFLGIFKIIARVQAQVDAGTGDVKVIKPWWSFLTSGI